MPIIRTGESEHDKELAKWDLPKRLGGHNADGYEKYPQMLYKAFRNEDHGGKAMCMDTSYLYTSDPAKQARAEAFTRQCQHTVRNDDEFQKALAEGWRETQAQALDLLESYHREMAQAALEANLAARRMSAQAQAEFADHDAKSEDVITDVPAPKKEGKRTRVAVS